MQSKYTIEDIAKIAGVSRGTVSRVLNNHPSVSDEARAKVQDAIENKNNGVVLKSRYSGAAFQHSHGISVFFPWAESDFFPITPRKRKNSSSRSRYTNLRFAGGLADWVEFLRKYLEETRRERRNQSKNLNIRKDPLPPLRFDAPNETVLFVRGTTSNSSKTSDSETGSMKNPPDGFYQDIRLKR